MELTTKGLAWCDQWDVNDVFSYSWHPITSIKNVQGTLLLSSTVCKLGIHGDSQCGFLDRLCANCLVSKMGIAGVWMSHIVQLMCGSDIKRTLTRPACVASDSLNSSCSHVAVCPLPTCPHWLCPSTSFVLNLPIKTGTHQCNKTKSPSMGRWYIYLHENHEKSTIHVGM